MAGYYSKGTRNSSARRGLRLKSLWARHGEDYLFMSPYLVLFFMFTVIPVLVSIGLSFTYFNVLEAPRFIGLRNYFSLLLDDDIFVLAIKNTLILSVITGPVSFFLCLFLAWLVNEFPAKLRAFLTLLFYTPTLAGSAYLIWQIIYSGDSYGFINGLLMKYNLIYTPIQWLADPKYMMPSAIVVILWMSLGTSFLSFIAGFQNVDPVLYEAGAVDGVKNRWQELWFITLPSMLPQLLFGAVMSITASFGIGDVINGLFGFPSTNYVLHTMVHHLQDYGNIRFEMGYASAIATILFILMILTNQIVQRLLKKVGA
ncbi:MAG: carbohydrate ABC transporter permease [Saccharofermentanales bacterium]